LPLVTAYICKTCGVQHAESDGPPEQCIICEDERQYVGRGGQAWTTLDEMQSEGRRNVFHEIDPGVWSIHTNPRYAIGQRALLVQTDGGNFLWDMISYIDDETVKRVIDLGGIQGISMSHPHFYGAVVEWSRAFGRAPIYVPEADREWFVRPDEAVRSYSGALEVWPGMTLVQVGGHFEGSAVLHWRAGADGRGALFTGDSISVAADPRWVTFMRSYPNYIPLPPGMVSRIVDALAPYEFDRVYGGWLGNDVRTGGKEAVERSADRYIRWEQAGD
jgi:glyoxylase-like metal-dependent hydrolase (beta-lactamase superfamily II)